MKVVQTNFLLLVFVAAATTTRISGDSDFPQKNGVQNPKVRQYTWISESGHRPKRQTETATTPKPKKPRPSNIFSLISVLLTETRDDANRAFNEIGTLFNSQFANATTTRAPPPASTTTRSTSSTTDGDEDNEITTTTEQFRISRDEFFGVLRSNVQGIVNLFGKEFKVAIRDSNQNVREFGRDLGVALRPYFYNNNSSSNTKNNTRRNT